jgi:hypothetical protein
MSSSRCRRLVHNGAQFYNSSIERRFLPVIKMKTIKDSATFRQQAAADGLKAT